MPGLLWNRAAGSEHSSTGRGLGFKVVACEQKRQLAEWDELQIGR